MPQSPNILVIITDDQGYADISAYAHAASDISTPNMDRLANEGILFTQAYVTAPVCSPSRAGWNTGRYQQRWDGWSWNVGLPDNTKTLAEHLKSAGYTTGKFGKNDYGMGYHSAEPREYPLNHGFDEFVGFSSHAHDYFCLTEEIENSTPDPYGNSAALGQLFHNNTRKSYGDEYTTEVFTDEAISFLERHESEPFFLTVSYNSVHQLIHEVPDRYLEKHGAKPIPNYDPSMGTYRDYYAKYGRTGTIPEEDFRAYYLANIECLDDNVGRLLDTLDNLNIADNTLIFLFSDNGGCPHTGAINTPLRGSIYTIYEGGIRVPFIMRWPDKFAGGQTYPHVVSTLNIVPTCLSATNTDTEANLDGHCLLKTLANPEIGTVHTEPLFWDWGGQYAVRNGDWKLIQGKLHDPETKNPEPQDPALYNVAKDIGERSDLSKIEPETFQRLNSALENWREEMNNDPAKVHTPYVNYQNKK